jgi:hypothetical protein
VHILCSVHKPANTLLHRPIEYQKRLVAPSYSVSAIKANEHLIRAAGIEPLKNRLLLAADRGEIINIMHFFECMSFVSDIP